MSEIVDIDGVPYSERKKQSVFRNIELIEDLVRRSYDDYQIVYRQLYPTGCTLDVKPIDRIGNNLSNIQNAINEIKKNI